MAYQRKDEIIGGDIVVSRAARQGTAPARRLLFMEEREDCYATAWCDGEEYRFDKEKPGEPHPLVRIGHMPEYDSFMRALVNLGDLRVQVADDRPQKGDRLGWRKDAREPQRHDNRDNRDKRDKYRQRRPERRKDKKNEGFKKDRDGKGRAALLPPREDGPAFVEPDQGGEQ